jgi:hypothetical protein
VKLLAVLANLSWCRCRSCPCGQVGIRDEIDFITICSGVDDVIRNRERIKDGMVAAVEAVRLDGTVEVRGGASELLAVEVEYLLEFANGCGAYCMSEWP